MKNITLTALLVFFVQCCLAQNGQIGNVTIFSEAGEPFYLVLNGQKQNDKPQTNLRVEGLSQPYYSARIIFADKTLPDVTTSNLALTDADEIFQDVTYRIKNDKKDPKKRKLNFFSMVPAEQYYVAPPDLYVVHAGQPSVNTNINFITNINTSINTNVNTNMDTNLNMGVNMGVNVNMTETHSQTQSGFQQPVRQNEVAPCRESYAIAPRDFTSALSSVKKQTFADTQLKVAKQIASANCLNANQISELCKLFSFEDNKLDFAKFAYDSCTDPQNYYKLSGLFSFSSNAEELADYVQNLH